MCIRDSIKVDGKDYRYRTNLKTILFLGIDTTDETKNQGQSDACLLYTSRCV